MPMRLVRGLALLAFLCVLPACGPSKAERERLAALARAQFPPEPEINIRVRERLKEPISVRFEATPFNETISFFRHATGVNYYVNWKALKAVGVEPGEPVNLELAAVAGDQVLRMLLEQIPTSEATPIGYSVIDGIVTISTQRDLVLTSDTRIYDIRDVVRRMGGAWEDEGSPRTLAPREEREQIIQRVTKLIEQTVGRRGEWEGNGGTESSVYEINGSLIVKTTPENHRAVFDLLNKLRGTPAPPHTLNRAPPYDGRTARE